jgi:hypothetical protein
MGCGFHAWALCGIFFSCLCTAYKTQIAPAPMEGRVIANLLDQVAALKSMRSSLLAPPKSKFLIVDEVLDAKMRRWCSKKVVIVSGLPGQGKSLIVQQLAHIASSMGKTVHCLQWDKTSPIFAENGPDEYRTKEDGVVHTMVRLATSAWYEY